MFLVLVLSSRAGLGLVHCAKLFRLASKGNVQRKEGAGLSQLRICYFQSKRNTKYIACRLWPIRYNQGRFNPFLIF